MIASNPNRLVALLLAMACAGSAAAAEAQSRRNVSVEILLGYGKGYTDGTYRTNFIGAFDVVIARAFAAGDRVAPLAVLDLGAQGPFGAVEAICILDPERPGSCVPIFPAFLSAGLLGGISTPTGSLRIAGGPALVRASLDSRPHEAAKTLGLQLRAEAALVIFVFTVRGTYVPSYRGDSFTMLSYQVGLRL